MNKYEVLALYYIECSKVSTAITLLLCIMNLSARDAYNVSKSVCRRFYNTPRRDIMSFLSKLVGIGLVAGAAVAAVKLIEKVWPQDDALDDVVYTVETGEFPLEDGTDAEDAPEAPYRPFDPDAALAPVPNVNPVEAPPAVPVTDPTKIADPADFQDWDELGCQG